MHLDLNFIEQKQLVYQNYEFCEYVKFGAISWKKKKKKRSFVKISA